jgi:phospholipid/cholesterol/gamma-HCH transport system ATP-binding protein
MSAVSSSQPFFSLNGVKTRYGIKKVLRGVTLQIPQSQTTVILGCSGAGKSVLLKHLNGLLRPDSGSVRVCGEEITALSERQLVPIRRKIGILFQDGALFDSLTVGENIAFPLQEGGIQDSGQITAAVAKVLEEVELPGEQAKMPSTLSGGMRKRVALARALVSRPECLLCDEPTAGLDPVLSQTISLLIRRMTEDHRLTSVVVSHDLEAMRLIADHVIFLLEGRVRYAGDLAGLEQCEDDVIRAFFSAKGGGG